MSNPIWDKIWKEYDKLNAKYKPKNLGFDLDTEREDGQLYLGKFDVDADGNPDSFSHDDWFFKDDHNGRTALLNKLKTLLTKGK